MFVTECAASMTFDSYLLREMALLISFIELLQALEVTIAKCGKCFVPKQRSTAHNLPQQMKLFIGTVGLLIRYNVSLTEFRNERFSVSAKQILLDFSIRSPHK